MGGTLSWDIFLMIGFIAVVAYGFLMQRDKAVVTMISIYVAIVATALLVGPVQEFFTGEKALLNQVFIRSSANVYTIQLVIFIALVALISMKSGLAGDNRNGSIFEILGFSVINAALLTSSILFFMDPAKREVIVQTSKLAKLLVTYHTWIMVVPVFFLIFTGWSKKD